MLAIPRITARRANISSLASHCTKQPVPAAVLRKQIGTGDRRFLLQWVDGLRYGGLTGSGMGAYYDTPPWVTCDK